MKKQHIALALILILALSLTLFTACGVKAVVESVEFGQTTYVLGQELNLASGKLNVDLKGEKQQLPLTTEGVTVSGYDSNKLGEQTVSVTYEEQTVTAKVTVVQRIVANNIKQDYVVGEDFYADQGSLTITRDDGTNLSVFLNDPALTITGFDSTSEALPLTLSATYQENGSTYQGNFVVYVYGIDSAKLTKPVKTTYDSHEPGLDLTGGYITVESALGTNFVALTTDMCQGFNLSAVSESKPTDEQTITVTYLGKTFTFKVTVNYSNVSFVKDCAKQILTQYDWTGTEPPVISAEHGLVAQRGLERYFALSQPEMAIISQEETLALVKTACVYLKDLYETEVAKYQDAFTVSEGKVLLRLRSYQSAKDAYTDLTDPNAAINGYANVLSGIKEAFGQQLLVGETKVETYLASVYSTEELSQLLPMFGYLVGLYEDMAVVPTDWTAETVSTYSTQIDVVVATIGASSYVGANYRALYAALNTWRTDYFDIIYTYYFVSENASSLQSLPDVFLPGALEDVFDLIAQMTNEIYGMNQQQVVDSTWFMYLYKQAEAKVNEVLNSNDEVLITVYYVGLLNGFAYDKEGNPLPATLNQLMTMLRTTSFGVYQHGGFMTGNKQFDLIWDKYLVVINGATSPEYVDSEQFKTEVRAMFDAFASASPSVQYAFIRSINVFYDNGFPTLAMDTSEYYYTLFTYLLDIYYSSVLTEEQMGVFHSLLVSMEYYSIANLVENDLDAFVTSMKATVTAFNALPEDQQSDFNSKVGDVYTRYANILNNYETSAPAKDDLGEWEGYFNAIASVVNDLNGICNNLTQSGGSAYLLKYVSAFEYAEGLVNEITTKAPKEIVNSYYYDPHINIKNGDISVGVSLDYLLNVMFRPMYVQLVTKNYVSLGGEQMLLIDAFNRMPTLREFIKDSYYLLWYTNPETLTSDYVDVILEVLRDFRNLTAGERSVFLAMDINSDYYNNLDSFLTKLLNADSTLPIAQMLFAWEKDYQNYLVKKGEVTLEYLEQEFAKIETAVAGLTGTGLANYENSLKEIVDFYREALNKLTQSN